MRPTQFFSEEYLQSSRRMRPEQILAFLEDSRLLHGDPRPETSRLISIKIPEPLLAAFKAKAKAAQTPYQTQIKKLMRQWLDG